MIPCITVPPLQLGPLAIQPFGALAAIGVICATTIAMRAVRRDGADPDVLNAFSGWALIAGVVLAVLYAISRFSPDFLRSRHLAYVDARYLGLTPAQFACIALFGYGLYRLSIRRPPFAAK